MLFKVSSELCLQSGKARKVAKHTVDFLDTVSPLFNFAFTDRSLGWYQCSSNRALRIFNSCARSCHVPGTALEKFCLFVMPNNALIGVPIK